MELAGPRRCGVATVGCWRIANRTGSGAQGPRHPDVLSVLRQRECRGPPPTAATRLTPAAGCCRGPAAIWPARRPARLPSRTGRAHSNMRAGMTERLYRRHHKALCPILLCGLLRGAARPSRTVTAGSAAAAAGGKTRQAPRYREPQGGVADQSADAHTRSRRAQPPVRPRRSGRRPRTCTMRALTAPNCGPAACVLGCRCPG